MTTPFSSETLLAAMVRRNQILIAGLIMGAIVFMAVALITRGGRAPARLWMVSAMAASVTLVALTAREIIARASPRIQRRKLLEGTSWGPMDLESRLKLPASLPLPITDGDKLLIAYLTQSIIKAGLVEGPAFFCLVAYLIEGHIWILAVSGILLIVLAVNFPTRERIERWVRQQLELMELERSRIP